MKSIYEFDHENIGIAPRLPDRKYGYFRDDQVVLLVTHREDVIPKEELSNIAIRLNEPLKEIKADAEVSSTPRVDTFRMLPNPEAEGGMQSVVSMLTYTVEKPPENPDYLMRIVEIYNKQTIDSLVPGLKIVGASPNWLSSVTSHGSGTGGPGGRPTPFRGSRTGAPAGFESLITSLTQKNIYGAGEGVDVVVLDTAPCAQALVAAPKEWPDHPILSTLLGPLGKLTLYPAPYDEVVRLGNTSLNDHDYNMTDHGLFVAGIIHSIVPKAKIHLIEVLNQYGVGDFASFVRGLDIVMNQIFNPGRKLVINCSWMLELPRDEVHCHHRQDADPDAQFERQVLAFSVSDQTTATMLAFLFDQFALNGRHAIAAAGNDGREDQTLEIPARYPAALTNVTGVAALPKLMPTSMQGEYERSTYSNLADDPEHEGIATLGGEPGEGNGVLGVYIGEFPVELNPSLLRRILNWFIILLGGRVAGPPNITKWAWWAGTSFATPILTGTVAAALASSNAITSTQAALQKLYDSGIIGKRSPISGLSRSTVQGEDVMPVLQG